MDAVTQRLEQLDKEIANAATKADNAQQAYQSERDPQQEAKLEKIWQQLLKDKEALFAGRKALEAQLTAPGVHAPLLAHNHSVSSAERLV